MIRYTWPYTTIGSGDALIVWPPPMMSPMNVPRCAINRTSRSPICCIGLKVTFPLTPYRPACRQRSEPGKSVDGPNRIGPVSFPAVTGTLVHCPTGTARPGGPSARRMLAAEDSGQRRLICSSARRTAGSATWPSSSGRGTERLYGREDHPVGDHAGVAARLVVGLGRGRMRGQRGVPRAAPARRGRPDVAVEIDPGQRVGDQRRVAEMRLLPRARAQPLAHEFV